MPGEVTVEFATEEAVRLGTVTAALRATLLAADGVPGFESRATALQDLRYWHLAANARLDLAIERLRGLPDPTPADELKAAAPAIRERFEAYEADDLAFERPIFGRIDLHLGQIVVDDEGRLRIVDFEGDTPSCRWMTAANPRRRSATSPRCSARSSMSVRARVAESRRVTAVNWSGPAWTSRHGSLGSGSGSSLRMSPVSRRPDRRSSSSRDYCGRWNSRRKCAEFAYAATFLPSWLWAPREGMRALVELPLDVTRTRRAR